jgi:hypothetical protein
MRKSIIACLFLLLALAAPAMAQGDDFLERFSVLGNEGNVLLQWTTRSGNTCNGIEILRSTDSIHFDEVGRIAGVCGSPGEAQAFTFTDLAPVINQTNYYKLNLGSVGVSSVRAIEVVSLQAPFLIKPHPVVAESKLYFENSNHEACTLTLISPQGQPAFTQDTRAEYFVIDASAHFPGIYFFKIQNPEGMRIATGKIMLR